MDNAVVQLHDQASPLQNSVIIIATSLMTKAHSHISVNVTILPEFPPVKLNLNISGPIIPSFPLL